MKLQLSCKPISDWFPNEVITRIIEAAPPSGQAALCSTSGMFYALGVPVLYRGVKLDGNSTIDSFCSTILENPVKFAELVRSLTVTASTWLHHRNLSRFPGCCRLLLKIESMWLYGPYLLTVRHQLLDAIFPHLVRCTLSLQSIGVLNPAWQLEENPHTSFLIRHPGLKTLWIVRDLVSGTWPSTSARIPMPNLQCLRAPATVLSYITEAQLKEVRLDFKDSIGFEATFTTFGSLTRTDVPFVASLDFWADDCTKTVDSALKHMPHLNTLQLMLHHSLMDTPGHPIIASLERCIAGFTGLAYFSFRNAGYVHDSFTFDYSTVKAWGDIRPTLQACRIDDRAWRRVNEVWEALSIDDFFVLAGISFTEE
ncbi:hypothetical protein DFH08DRAFT_294793 [Mycena albidolilacea]|uniref:F-box domain-containing protein n=1 Tax=Mycena albidolilacea TaxID=1033008 RepID=A0AAD6ZR39_9AGAR|nr:hypothetical protein DFH08DRAFT_294793 [Mycena albidolilacea]